MARDQDFKIAGTLSREAEFRERQSRAREKKRLRERTRARTNRKKCQESKDLFSSDLNLIEQHISSVHSIPPTHSFDWRIEVKQIVVDSRRSLSIFESFFKGFHMRERETFIHSKRALNINYASETPSKAVVFLLIQSMKYAARLASRENEVIREFHSVSIATICLRNGTTKRGKMMWQDDDIKNDMHSSSRSRNKDPNTKLNK